MILIDGKQTSDAVKSEIAQEVSKMVADGKRAPHLAAVLVGNDGASLTYVNAKVKACEKVGFQSTLITLPADISEKDLLDKISELNSDNELDGYIVQLPLPKHIDENKVTLAVDPEKDVDGFHPTNLGKMLLGQETYLPATPYGIMEMLERYNIETSGKHTVVIGRSHIVGSPMSVLMARKGYPGDSTVTLTHSRTKNLSEITKQADIVIVANGIPEFLTADMVKDGVVVIDVGITRVEDSSKKSGFRLLGDVKFDEVSAKASHITPVPGGVGPMTIAMLMKNTLQARKEKINCDKILNYHRYKSGGFFMELDILFKFLLASMALTFMPGPDNIFVLSESINKGYKTGVSISLGLVSGIVVHTTIAATGLGLILVESDLIFKIISYLGAVYLIYLAYQAFKELNDTIVVSNTGNKLNGFGKLYLKGFTMNVLNPKVTMFFLAFLPQFVNKTSTVNPIFQMGLLGLIFMVQALLIFSLISILSSKFSQLIDNPTFWKVSNISRVIILLLLAVALLVG